MRDTIMSMNREQTVASSTALSAALFIGLWGIYGCVIQDRDWGTTSRLLLTYALVQDGTSEVTGFVSSGGRLLEHPQTRDLAVNDQGRFFSDKAPGQSWLGVPAYWLALGTGLASPFPHAAHAIVQWPGDYWVTWWSVGLIGAATSSLLFLTLVRMEIRALPAMAASLALGLATLYLPYATLFYGHASAGFFTLLSVNLLTGPRRGPARAFLAGVAAGYATMIDYPLAAFALLASVGLMAAAIFSPPSRTRQYPWLAFVAGGAPMACLLGYYHYRVTGSPFRFPYSLEVMENLFGYHKEGYGIPIGAPKWEVVQQLLFGLPRGLAWYSPALLGAIPGSVLLLLRSRYLLAWLILSTFVALLVIHAGFPAWEGGWATGPRFLIPAFPLLALATGVWLDFRPPGRWSSRLQSIAKGIWALVVLASGLMLLGFTMTGVRVTPAIDNPPRDYLWWKLSRGELTGHVGGWICDRTNWALPNSALAIGMTVILPLSLTALLLACARTIDRRAAAE